MKKGWLVLLVIVIAIVIFLFNMFVFSLWKISGKAITEENESVSEDVQIMNRCFIDYPLQCVVWKAFPEKNEIILQLQNPGFGHIVVWYLKVTGCEAFSEALLIEGDTGKPITLHCPIERGEVFRGNISLIYRSAKGGLFQNSSGTVVQKIE